MPEFWLGRLNGHKDIEKVYPPDIMFEAYKRGVSEGYRHYLYGGKEGVADKLAAVIKKDYPGNSVSGTYCPPFRPLELLEYHDIANTINATKPDIVWCGLDCPKQERWMATMRPLLDAPILIGVGAGFDFPTGEKPLAPKWVQRSGFEWFYRMLSKPRRMVGRYAGIVPPKGHSVADPH